MGPPRLVVSVLVTDDLVCRVGELSGVEAEEGESSPDVLLPESLNCFTSREVSNRFLIERNFNRLRIGAAPRPPHGAQAGDSGSTRRLRHRRCRQTTKAASLRDQHLLAIRSLLLLLLLIAKHGQAQTKSGIAPREASR